MQSKLLMAILSYGASLMVTVVVIAIYPVMLVVMLIQATISFTKGYISNTKDLLLDILEVD